MPEKPDYVKNYPKPKNTEIKYITGHWYLYERPPYYDPVKKQTRRKSGPIIGRITPDGLIPSTHRKKPAGDSSEAGADSSTGDSGSAAADRPGESPAADGEAARTQGGASAQKQAAEHPVSVDTGDAVSDGMHMRTIRDTLNRFAEEDAVRYLYGLTEKLRECLKLVFPDCWKIVYTFAMLRAIHGDDGRFCNLERQYQECCLSSLYPGMTLAPEKVKEFLGALGQERGRIEAYLREICEPAEQIVLLNVRRRILPAADIPTVGRRRKAGNDRRTQPDVLYLFTETEYPIGIPTYYQQYAGRRDEMNTFMHFLEKSGLSPERLTIIGEEGCAGSSAFQDLEDCGLHYILPVPRGMRGTKSRLPAFEDFNGSFTAQGRGIRYVSRESEDHRSKEIIYLDPVRLAGLSGQKLCRGGLLRRSRMPSGAVRQN